jgi:hydroxymethylpyrimidine pyrophosphatase-like HAD family hydrolase
MEKKLILLDVDGTITNSGCKIDSKMENILILLSQNFELGIVGGGKIDKIIW